MLLKDVIVVKDTIEKLTSAHRRKVNGERPLKLCLAQLQLSYRSLT